MDEQTNAAKITGKFTVISTIITGICVIMSAFIGIFSFNVNIENDVLLERYEKIYLENEYLKEKNSDLQNQILSLTEENEALKILLSSDNDVKGGNFGNEVSTNSSTNIVSIFDLDTFRGEGGWHKSIDDIDYTDTYDNEYVTSYWGKHYAVTKNIEYSFPTYLLDNKYSICYGQMAWSKGSKNIEGSAWLEFYSDDKCIYMTEPISADSKILDFSFSVEGLEKLTIVRNATKDMNDWDKIHIVYPHLNLME